MKIFKLFTALIATLSIYSQDLDQRYLDSLPENVKDEVITKIDARDEVEKPIYRRASSSIDKAEEDEERVKIFGYEFFDTIQTTFMPINEPNLSGTYILDFGDVIQIQMIGQKDSISSHAIERSGSINIQDIGSIQIAGMSLDEASNYIKEKVKNIYIGTEAFVTLEEVRDITILISGDAFNPGVYTLNGNSNILHAIAMAGGINNYGSYRKIKHIRNNDVINTIDIYDLLIEGSSNFGTNLRSGDVILVSPSENYVEVMGAVKRPGIYELTDNEYLFEAIKYANGVSKSADLTNLYLQRFTDGKVNSLKINDIEELKTISVNDGDKVLIRKYELRDIEVTGAVLNPGKYYMRDDETIYDAIDKAGGYLPNAYIFGVIYENLAAKRISETAIQYLYDQFLENIVLSGQQSLGDYDPLVAIQAAEFMKNIVPNGRIVVDFQNPDSKDALLVQNGDKITVPEKSNQVYLFGEVSYEGATTYVDGKEIDFYINNKGGFTSYADKSRVFIIHPNGITENIEIKKNIFQSLTSSNNIYPGSIIYVPQKIDNPSLRRLNAQAYASILGNIALSLASLNSISTQ